MTQVEAFNEWMRRYIDEPERFQREWEAVEEFRREHNNGVEPSYGAQCSTYLMQLMAEDE